WAVTGGERGALPVLWAPPFTPMPTIATKKHQPAQRHKPKATEAHPEPSTPTSSTTPSPRQTHHPRDHPVRHTTHTTTLTSTKRNQNTAGKQQHHCGERGH